VTIETAFGEVIREIRRESGLSQEQLGFDSACHRTYISLLERGKKSPTLNTIFRLAEPLGVSPRELVRRVEVRLARVPATGRGKRGKSA
jgi:transcriptional regulator with XRE-family HTH domain